MFSQVFPCLLRLFYCLFRQKESENAQRIMQFLHVRPSGFKIFTCKYRRFISIFSVNIRHSSQLYFPKVTHFHNSYSSKLCDLSNSHPPFAAALAKQESLYAKIQFLFVRIMIILNMTVGMTFFHDAHLLFIMSGRGCPPRPAGAGRVSPCPGREKLFGRFLYGQQTTYQQPVR